MGWSEKEGHTGRWTKNHGPSDTAQPAGRCHAKVPTLAHGRSRLPLPSEGSGRNCFSTRQRQGCREGSQPGTKSCWLFDSTNQKRMDMGKGSLNYHLTPTHIQAK